MTKAKGGVIEKVNLSTSGLEGYLAFWFAATVAI